MPFEYMCSESMDFVDPLNVSKGCGDYLMWKKGRWKKGRYLVPLHPRATAVISVDINRSKYNINPCYVNSFPVFFCNTNCLSTLFASSSSKTSSSQSEIKHLNSGASLFKVCDLPHATIITYDQDCNTFGSLFQVNVE